MVIISKHWKGPSINTIILIQVPMHMDKHARYGGDRGVYALGTGFNNDMTSHYFILIMASSNLL